MSDNLIKSSDCIKVEKEEISEIMKCVNNFEDFVVKAGAGSGKTYSLVEAITSILEEKNQMLMLNNQRILCITYTNAATNEIKERIGNTSLAVVFTIHDFLWTTIKDYQPQLVDLHVEEIKLTIEETNEKLDESKYSELLETEKDELKDTLIRNKDQYYQIRNLKAAPFKEKLPLEFKEKFKVVLSNFNNFKSIANWILFRDRLSETLENIYSKKDGYVSVEYDANINKDRLTRMKISHDTLLKYSKNLVEKYDLLKTILVDRYPYILVDEYQDTNPLVIDLLPE